MDICVSRTSNELFPSLRDYEYLGVLEKSYHNNSNKETHLFIATKLLYNHPVVLIHIRELLKNNPELVNKQNITTRETPLFHAVLWLDRKVYVDVVKLFIEHNVNVDAQDIYGNTALHCLVKNFVADDNFISLLKLLLERANPNLCNIYGNSPLYELVYYFDNQISSEKNIKYVRETIKLFIAAGTNLLHHNKSNVSVLDYINKKSNISCVLQEISSQDIKNDKDKIEKDVIGIKSNNNHQHIVTTMGEEILFPILSNYPNLKMLIAHYNKLSPYESELYKCIKIAKQYPEIMYHIREIIQKDPNIVNSRNENGGETPLFIAVFTPGNQFYMPIVKLLLKHGADPNIQDNNGLTPLHMITSNSSSIGHNFINTVCLLFFKNANPNLKDKYGDTPLHKLILHINFALSEEKYALLHQCIEIFIKHGANLMEKNKSGISVLDSMEKLPEIKKFSVSKKNF